MHAYIFQTATQWSAPPSDPIGFRGAISYSAPRSRFPVKIARLRFISTSKAEHDFVSARLATTTSTVGVVSTDLRQRNHVVAGIRFSPASAASARSSATTPNPPD